MLFNDSVVEIGLIIIINILVLLSIAAIFPLCNQSL